MAQNLDVFDFELTAEDLEKLNSMDKGKEGRALLVPW
jgi:diketogulonate reductase-like aldo/keto reductase